MKIHLKIFLFVVLVLIAIEALTVFRYERLLVSERKDMNKWQEVAGGVSVKKYTAPEIIQLIRSSPDWLGDSITIYENGEIQSSLGGLQGTINNVINSKPNLEIVQQQMQTNKLPYQYNVYMLAAGYYKVAHPTDSTSKLLRR